MYTPQTEPIPTLTLPEPKLDYPVIVFFRRIMGLYVRALKFREPVMIRPERMVNAYRQFQEKKIRLIVGFRHAYGDDPQLMAYTFHHVLPRAARKIGKPLKGITHAHFIYGVEVPMWSGRFVRWVLPKAGAVPIDHIRMDSKGMNRIRKMISDGAYPLALAPEGHVTYGSERIVELETGTARFGFWCIEDLERQGRSEDVVFLPVSTHYRYGAGIEKKLGRFIALMEADCGIKKPGKGSRHEAITTEDEAIADRLRAVGIAILGNLAEAYTELGGKKIEATQVDLLEAALQAAERIFALVAAPDDKPMARLYRIRATGWNRIFRDDIESMTPLRHSLASRETGEAWYAMRHMETCELLTYVDLEDVPDGAHVERYVEIANNFHDLIERQKGGTLRNRANAFAKYAIIVPGEPIDMNRYYDLYKADKKAALRKATDDIHTAYETCVKEYKNEFD